MRGYKKRLVQFFGGLMIVLLVTGVSVFAANPPRVRVVHAAPVVPNIDFYVVIENLDTLFFDNISYSHITQYVPVDAGDRPVKIRAAMTSYKDPSFIEFNIGFNPDQDYSIIIAGSVDNRQHWWISDNNQELPGTGASLVRIIHASFDTPATEVCIGDVCRTISFKQSSEYFLMDPGVYTPQVNLNGTDPSYIKVPPLVLQDNSIHTVFLTGKRHGEPNLELLYTFDAGEPDVNPHPPSPDQPPGGHPSPPVYPPETGAFLSLRAMGMIASTILIVVGGIGFWLTRTRKS